MNCTALSTEVSKALQQYAATMHLNLEKICYEVNGFGSFHLMMMPMFLLCYRCHTWAPFCIGPVYKNTRSIFFTRKPFLFKGKAAEVCSPHTGLDLIWPIGLIVRALTALMMQR